MQEYRIDVSRIEELQTINDTDELGRLFERAKSTIVNGEKVVLVRRQADGSVQPFDEMSTLDDLEAYRNQVYKYL